MKAVVSEKYGPPEVLNVEEVKKPVVKNNEILIKVKAASVNSGDVRMRALDAGEGIKGVIGKIFIRLLVGVIKPRKTPGSVLAGIVEETGGSVTRFKSGDEVYAMTGFSFGGFAEYCVLPEKRAIALKPEKAGFEEASAIPFGGNTALYFLRKSGIDNAKKVLIWGSTGAVGSFAVQIASNYGTKVTAVCGTDGVKLSKKLGADTVYNYTKTAPADIEGKFDIVFDAVGKVTKKQVEHLLSENGTYITVNGFDVAKELSSDLEELSQMFDAGKIVSPIDKIFDLNEIVEANRFVDAGHKKGSVVIRM